MRDLTKITLVRDDTPTEIGKLYPHAGPLLAARWNEDLISDCWPDLLRMGGSLKYGQASASLIDGKWPASSRQNTMAAALKQLRADGRSVPGELLAHISPGHSDNINFFGVINVDIEAELAKLTGGWRPMRPAQLRELGL